MIRARLTFLDHVRVDHLRRVHPGFPGIYQRNLGTKFETIKGSDFKSLKERILFVQHLGKNRDLDLGKRAEFIKVLLSEGNVHEALKMIHNSDKEKESGIVAKGLRFLGLQSDSESEEEVLKKEMKKIAKAVSDSQFLRGLESLETEDLQPAIQEAEALAHTSLSSSIDATVKKMTHEVLHMQKERCKVETQKEIQAEEARALKDVLVDFIRDLNTKSAGGTNS